VLANRRRVAVLVLLALVVGLLLQMPLGLASIRLCPLSLLWWYAAVVAPVLAVAVTALSLCAGGERPE
jgi:hypothetical protein